MKLPSGNTTFLILGVAMMLSACAKTSQIASEENFKKALNAHFSKMKECSGVGTGVDDEGYVGVFHAEGRDWTAKDRERFEVLEKLGVLEVTRFQKSEKSTLNPGSTNAVDYVGYTFSAMGAQYVRPAELDAGNVQAGIPQLCYGTKQIVDVLNFTEPVAVSGVKASNVKFTYKLVDIAPWADSPSLKASANNTLEGSEDLVLTKNGWKHHLVVK
ncbi:hypothetical protein [Hellea balneolensis]|uniref:hypothetical protein n=1 Tax=Hellea balneolensis TaxID=287478 RepID=UPI00040176BB|nr:hypothetical protein [Hellea balneolensis]